MKKPTVSKSAFSVQRVLAFLLCALSLFLALLGISGLLGTAPLAQGAGQAGTGSIQVGASYHNDVSPPLRELAMLPFDARQETRRPAQPEVAEFA